MKKYSKNSAAGNFFGPSYFDPALDTKPFLTVRDKYQTMSLGIQVTKHFLYQMANRKIYKLIFFPISTFTKIYKMGLEERRS